MSGSETKRPTGSDLVDAHAEARARKRYSAHVDSQVSSALQSAQLGIFYKPFADAPGAIEASPATFWDYFLAELSILPLRTFIAGERSEASGQTDLGVFERGETA